MPFTRLRSAREDTIEDAEADTLLSGCVDVLADLVPHWPWWQPCRLLTETLGGSEWYVIRRQAIAAFGHHLSHGQ